MTLYCSACTGQFNQVIKKEVPAIKGTNGKVPANRAKAIKPGPLTAAAHFNRGLAYHDKGDNSHAQADFDMAKELGYK